MIEPLLFHGIGYVIAAFFHEGINNGAVMLAFDELVAELILHQAG